MGRKNRGGKNKGRGDDDHSDQEKIPQGGSDSNKKEETKADTTAVAAPKLSRKQQRLAKQQVKQQQQKNHDCDSDDDDDDLARLGGLKLNNNESDDDSDDGSDEELLPPLPAKKGKKKDGPLIPDDSKDDDDDDDDDYLIPQPASKKNKKKGVQFQQSMMMMDDDDESDDDESDDEDGEQKDDDDEETEQIAFKILDDDRPSKSKKKKDKKEKKEKKEKKKKEKKEKKSKKEKKKKDNNDNDDSGNNSVDEEEVRKVEIAAEKKSKFQLQMEAAMKKKEKEEEEASASTTTKAKKALTHQKQATAATEIPKVPDKLVGEEDNNNEVLYGAPDDVVWSDKSNAQREADAAADNDDPSKLLFGKDGKKLSNKERKRLIKEREAAERAAEYEKVAAKASEEGAQFGCSQTAVNSKDPQWLNSLDINIPSFSISAAGKILFKDATLNIAHGRRYGLVGANGRGKSTLLKMIASRDLLLPPRIDFLYVEQEVVADNTPAVEAVLRADKTRWNLMAEEKTLMAKVDAGDESEETIDRLGIVVEELTNMGADAMEAKAHGILSGLGFTTEMQTKATKMFSGGWRMRISLARALFVEPTLLMLDEPTNHLDLNAVIWLDDYLQTWKKTLFVVSHDQDFLNSVCQEVLHIEDLKLIAYKGNYDSFKKVEKDRLKQQLKAYEKQEKRIRDLKRQGQSKNKATETMKIQSKREAGARSSKKKNQAIAAGTEAREVQELIKRPKEYTVKLEFSEVPQLSRPVMDVTNVHFRYSPKHPVIFDKIDFGIDMESRICVVGPNGAGKTTLLKLLTGEITPTKGDVKRNQRLRMGIYNQHFVDRLPMGKTPIEHLRDRFADLDYQSCRNRLGRYGLEGHAHEVVMRDLSGGQKARVVLVELSLQMPHILLLDEPTNNLDIETIDALCDAINEFNGGIVVVTHDQRLIEECDCTLWVVEKEGVTEWKEGFDDYKETILRQLEEQVEKQNQVRKQKVDAAATVKAEKIARLAKKKEKK